MLLVDNRGLACPQPVINTRRVLERNPGETVAALVDNPMARDNLVVMAEGLGCRAEWTEDGAGFKVTIHPPGEPAAGPPAPAALGPAAAAGEACPPDPRGPLVVVLASDRLGQGDEVLGGLLMKSFLTSLIEVEAPATLICLNRGVLLSAAGSPVLELLAQLASRGTEILSCGTCLDFYERKDRLQVGTVSNMFTIVQRMAAAGRLIRW